MGGVFYGFRQIGKQGFHLTLGFKIMLIGFMPPVIMKQRFAFGNAKQHIMGIGITLAPEIAIISGDNWDVIVICHIQQLRFYRCFAFCVVALNFNIKPIGENRHQTSQPPLGQISSIFCQW